MTPDRINSLAEVVDTAAHDVREIDMITADEPGMTLEDAYLIQERSVERRLGRGEALVGLKMGLTSRAKMEQMGVHEPIYGRLTSSMIVPDGGSIRMTDLCHPRVEPEVAFLLKSDLRGPVTPAQALEAVSGVYAALEVIDSRYKNFKFTLPDVIADNTSAIRFVLGGDLVAVDDLNLGNLGMVMEINGEIVQTGSSAAIYEHPARSLAELATMLSRRGMGLTAGQIILAGGATAAVAIKAGDHIRLEVDEIGSVEFRVVE